MGDHDMLWLNIRYGWRRVKRCFMRAAERRQAIAHGAEPSHFATEAQRSEKQGTNEPAASRKSRQVSGFIHRSLLHLPTGIWSLVLLRASVSLWPSQSG